MAGRVGTEVAGVGTRVSGRKRLWDVLQVADPMDPATRIVGVFISVLIIANVLAVILETVESLRAAYSGAFYGITSRSLR